MILRKVEEEIKKILPDYKSPEDKNSYCKIHLEKAWAHLYRAGHDAYEIRCINLLKQINTDREKISREFSIADVNTVITDFYGGISKVIEEAKKENINARALKDIDPEREDVEKSKFFRYEKIVDDLETIPPRFNDAMPGLVELSKKRKKESRESLFTKIGAGLVGTVVGGFFVNLFNKFLP